MKSTTRLWEDIGFCMYIYISWDSFYLIPIPATFTRRPDKHKHVSLFSKHFDSLFSSGIDSLSSIERGNTKNNIWSLQLMRNALAFEAFSETHQIAAKIKDCYFDFSSIVLSKI